MVSKKGHIPNELIFPLENGSLALTALKLMELMGFEHRALCSVVSFRSTNHLAPENKQNYFKPTERVRENYTKHYLQILQQ